MVRLLIGSLIAALVMFGWGFYFWMILADQADLLLPLPNEGAKQSDIVGALNASLEESGVYYYPMAQPEEDEDAFKERHKEGPLLMIHFHAGGTDPNDWRMYAAGFVHMLLVCFLLGSILNFAAKPSWAYLTRVGFLLVVGVTASVFIDGNWVVWWHSNVKFHHYSAIYHVGGVLFAGLVLAAFIKAKPAAA